MTAKERGGPCRITIERTRRDADDATAHTVASWSIEVDDGSVVISTSKEPDRFASISLRDIEQFCADLEAVVEAFHGADQ